MSGVALPIVPPLELRLELPQEPCLFLLLLRLRRRRARLPQLVSDEVDGVRFVEQGPEPALGGGDVAHPVCAIDRQRR
jgi:hypothetical protein